MAYEVLFTASAEEDFVSIGKYLAETLANPPAAASFTKSAEAVVHTLAENPFLFPLCSDPYLGRLSYRSAGIGNYLAIFRITTKPRKVLVLRIFHQTQNYPEHMRPKRQRRRRGTRRK